MKLANDRNTSSMSKRSNAGMRSRAIPGFRFIGALRRWRLKFRIFAPGGRMWKRDSTRWRLGMTDPTITVEVDASPPTAEEIAEYERQFEAMALARRRDRLRRGEEALQRRAKELGVTLD
jgi:hypothetical protein